MASFLITAPDGTKYNVTGPDGSTAEQALAQVQAQHQPAADPSAGGGTLSIGPIDTGIHTSEGVDRTLAGAGKYFEDLGRGVHELYARAADTLSPQSKSLSDLATGHDPSRLAAVRQEIADSRQTDAPLMATTAGKVGNAGAALLTSLPALAIPGANTVAGATAIGAAQGALQPSVTTGEGVTNVALGAAAGGIGQGVGNVVAKGATSLLAKRAAAATAEETQNAVRDATLKASQDAGYVVPPTATNPTLTNAALESVSGRAATNQAAMIKNQKITNALVGKDLNLPAGQPITQQALQSVRNQAGKVYQQVKQSGTIKTDGDYLNDLAGITNASEDVAKAFPGATTPAADKIDTLVGSLSQDEFSASQAVEYAKRLRQQASANFKLAGRSANPEDLALAQAQSKGANALEEMIGRHLEAGGNPNLLGQFQTARKQIAKTYTIDSALNDATGNVDARILAKQLDRNPAIDGNLKTAAQFGQAFKEVAGEPVKGPGVSKLAATVGMGEIATALAIGHPALAAAGVGAMAGPAAARALLLSKFANRSLATPNYAPGLTGTLALKGAQQSSRAALPLSLQAAYSGQPRQ